MRRSWLGVLIQDITPELKQALHLDVDGGALVSQVMPDGPARKAGIQRGDVVVGFDGQVIRNARELSALTITLPIVRATTIDVLSRGTAIRMAIITQERIEAEDRVVTASDSKMM